MKDLKDVLKGLGWGILLCALISMCASCSTTRSVSQEKTASYSALVDSQRVISAYVDSLQYYKLQLDSFTHIRTLRDSVIIRDSLVIIQDTAGNIVSREKYHDTAIYHASTDETHAATHESELLEKLQAHVDSLESLRARTDTLTQTKTIEKTITKKASVWQRICSWLTPWLLLVIFILGTYIYEKRV